MTDFFEKITGGIDRGLKTISSRSKEFIEITRLKGEMKDIDATLQSKFNVFGKKAFQMMNQGALKEEDLKAECAEIALCYKKITEIEDNIRKAEREALKAQHGFDAVNCRACGGINKVTDKFCKICGSTVAAEGNTDSRPCPSCKSLVSREAKFCASCGKTIPKNIETTQAENSARTCHNCSYQISAEEIFCQSCGTKQ